MNTKDAIALLDPKWHQEFLRFVETGEASEEFKEFMDRDLECQRAIEIAFKAHVGAFEDFARALREAEHWDRVHHEPLDFRGKPGGHDIKIIEKSAQKPAAKGPSMTIKTISKSFTPKTGRHLGGSPKSGRTKGKPSEIFK